MYVYIQSEKSHYEGNDYYPGLWTVGFFEPNGEWHPESDYSSLKEAADRVHWLNGGEVHTKSKDFYESI